MSTQSTISEVITSVLSEQGLSREPRATEVVEQVSQRLAEALDERVERVINLAASEGVAESTARQAFIDEGLANDAPAPVEATPSGDEDRIGKLEALVQRLVTAAERRGLSI
jgi:hypothetical protein